MKKLRFFIQGFVAALGLTVALGFGAAPAWAWGNYACRNADGRVVSHSNLGGPGCSQERVRASNNESRPPGLAAKASVESPRMKNSAQSAAQVEIIMAEYRKETQQLAVLQNTPALSATAPACNPNAKTPTQLAEETQRTQANLASLRAELQRLGVNPPPTDKRASL